MAIGGLEPDRCGPNARKAIHWTRPLLTDEEREFLRALPGHLVLESDLLLVHSCLGDPVARLTRPEQYAEQRDVVARFDPRIRVCFFGHTHVPEVREIRRDGGVRRLTSHRVRLSDTAFHFVNPGSVGHPRGTDNRAQYASFDLQARTIQFHRVRYDVRKVARENARHGVETKLGDPVLMHYGRRFSSKVTGAVHRVMKNLSLSHS
jgi:predicted phosphodiesterase